MNVENISEAKELLAEIEKLEFFLSHEGWECPNFKLASPVSFIVRLVSKSPFVDYRLPEDLKQEIKCTMERYLKEKKERLKQLEEFKRDAEEIEKEM